MIVKVVVPDSIYARVYFARGEQGAVGPTGNTGPQGPSGIVNVDSPITNSGTTTAANIGLNQALLQITPAQVTGTAVITTDSRLSDQRVPTDGSVTDTKIVAGGLSPNRITGTAVITTDSRLSDARTPLAHAATHGSAGSDPVTLAQSQVTNLVSDLAAKAPIDSPVFTTKVTIPFSSTFLQSTGTGELRAVASAPGLGYIPYTASVTTGIAWQELAKLVKTDLANTFTVGGHVINNNAVGTVPLVLKGVASQTANMLEIQDETNSTYASISKFGTTRLGGSVMSGGRLMVQAGGSLVGLQVRDGGASANIAEFQSSAGSVVALINSFGAAAFGTSSVLGRVSVSTGSTGTIGVVVRGVASQTANLQEWQNSAGSVLTSVNASGDVQGPLAGFSFASFGSTRSYVDNVALRVYANNASTQASIIRGAASQSANLQEWQNSAGTILARMTSAGVLRASQVLSLNGLASMGEFNNGAIFEFVKATGASYSPGANRATVYFRDGTNAGTLKLVVRAGAAGAETTILDNIPT